MTQDALHCASLQTFALVKVAPLYALQIKDCLLGPMMTHAAALLSQGFVVPDPLVLERASKHFDAVAALDTQGALAYPDTKEVQEYVDQICALSSTVQRLSKELSLQWSPDWRHCVVVPEAVLYSLALEVLGARWEPFFKQAMQQKPSMTIAAAATRVLHDFNARHTDALLIKVRDDCRLASDYYGAKIR